LIEPDDYTLAISLNWCQEEDDVVMIKETSDPEIIHPPLPPCKDYWLEKPLPSRNSRLASCFLYKVLAFEITQPVRISNNLHGVAMAHSRTWEWL